MNGAAGSVGGAGGAGGAVGLAVYGGGLVGYNSGAGFTMIDSYATGTVSVTGGNG